MERTSKPKVVGVSHAEMLAEQLKDPEFAAHYRERKTARAIAAAVRSMREQAAISQGALAGRIGVKQPMIARLEKGTDPRIPSLDVLSRVGEALGRKLAIRFEGAGAPIVIPCEAVRPPRARKKSVRGTTC